MPVGRRALTEAAMAGFRAFLTKSNALALAIGVVIGVALGQVVMTLVNAIITPPIGWALGSIDFSSIKTVLGTNAKGEEVSIGWGLFINALIVFFVVMLVVYVISKLFIKEEGAPGPSAEEMLLTEIRDELRKRPN
jgi:large conductance mechanosensitive channel